MALGKELPDATRLRLPCGGCLGCRASSARAWALRCQLELQEHKRAAFTTLTYSEENVPQTLNKHDLQRFLKRFRKKMGTTRPIRFFACGEYGTQTNRPHYHALLYGASERDADTIEETWGLGHARTTAVTPARIAYVAGYTAKKIGWKLQPQQWEEVNPETGEVTEKRWEPPFIQMSRRPGIGGEARQFAQSWRIFAVNGNVRQPVPRFLHEAWKKQATQEEIEELIEEKAKLALKRDTSEERLKAQEQIAIQRQKQQTERRQY